MVSVTKLEFLLIYFMIVSFNSVICGPKQPKKPKLDNDKGEASKRGTLQYKHFTREQWDIIQREELEMVAQSHQLNPRPLSDTSLRSLLYDIYNPPQANQGSTSPVSAARRDLPPPGSATNDNTKQATTSANTQQQQQQTTVSLTTTGSGSGSYYPPLTTPNVRGENHSSELSGQVRSMINDQITATLAQFFSNQNQSSSTRQAPSLFQPNVNNPSLPAVSPIISSSQKEQDGSLFSDQTPRPSSLRLPAVPSSVIQRIRRGEFVNFDHLLPQNLGRSTESQISLSFDGEKLLLSNNDGTGSSSTTTNKTKAKVVDFFTWSLAWTLFFQTMIQFRAYLAEKLLRYQFYITHLANLYSFSAWHDYDIAFRQSIANNPNHFNWDSSDDDLYNIHVRGRTERAKCYICGSGNHLAPHCPKGKAVPSNKHQLGNQQQSFPKPRFPGHPPTPPSFSGSNLPSVSPNFQGSRSSLPPQQGSRPPFPAPQRAQAAGQSAQVCKRWNQGQCTRYNCYRLHVCIFCGSHDHPGYMCH